MEGKVSKWRAKVSERLASGGPTLASGGGGPTLASRGGGPMLASRGGGPS